jgi:phosphoribosylformimino-5-aminoimidazole carboxamide ribotide isomerase
MLGLGRRWSHTIENHPAGRVILYPAIDIRGGKAVRLLQGDYKRETTYDADPLDAARRWAEEGAEFLHVVDLDGAKAGEPQNLDAVRRIAAGVECPIQVGGGLRQMAALDAVLEVGADRVVIGTAALRDPGFLARAVAEHGDRVVVSLDTRDGKVSFAGWTETSDLAAPQAIAELSERGVARFLCTAIEVDGTMEGPDIGQLNEIASTTTAAVIASGGVGNLAHLEDLARRGAPNIEGAIVGRALYERRFTVAEATAALAPNS